MLPNEQVNLLYVALGNRIKNEREAQGYKQTSFAKQIGISRSSLVNIEKGRQRTPLHVLYSIAELLEINMMDLLPKRKELDRTLNLSETDIKNKANFELQEESIDKFKEFLKKTNLNYE